MGGNATRKDGEKSWGGLDIVGVRDYLFSWVLLGIEHHSFFRFTGIGFMNELSRTLPIQRGLACPVPQKKPSQKVTNLFEGSADMSLYVICCRGYLSLCHFLKPCYIGLSLCPREFCS